MQYYGDLLRKLTKSNTTDVCEFFVKKCLMNAKNRSTNEAMKRFFMICAVSANDGIKEFLEKNELTFSGYWAHRRYFAKVKDGIPVVVKTYLSCMLLMLASQKKLIMKKTGMNELVAMAGHGEEGVQDVFSQLNGVCHERLNGGEPSNLPCNDANRDLLTYRVGEDVYVLVNRLQEMPNLN